MKETRVQTTIKLTEQEKNQAKELSRKFPTKRTTVGSIGAGLRQALKFTIENMKDFHENTTTIV